MGYKRTHRQTALVKMKKRIHFRPLSEGELAQIRVAAHREKRQLVTVKKEAVIRLLEERDAFAQGAMAGEWLLEEAESSGLERRPKDYVSPTNLEKAMGAARQAFRTLDDLGLGLPQTESERKGER